ncbi:FAD-dependent oxidoreductase [Streptomyces sp. NPDC005805]|uniref:NAD(P)/FAD-dependent oxidoreductase n=1 Tax=Streptomyces sp. NPDC005805 TaxID=3157068 RepID=UPI0033F15818
MSPHPSYEPPAEAPDADASVRTDVTVIGAGMIGLMTALSLARRGVDVVLVDDVVNQKPSYKVGESFLVSTGLVRTVGGLDDFLNDECFIKTGVWFSYGAEGRKDFEDLPAEWANTPMSEFTTLGSCDDYREHYLYQQAEDKLAYRSLAVDQQICRPDGEALLRTAAHAEPRIRFLDSARVADLDVGPGDERHTVVWNDHAAGRSGTVNCSWLVDCSGRTRLLAKKLGHRAEEKVFTDDFRTTAVWGQFDGITDELFEPVWRYRDPAGASTRRDLCTLHLWGKGYWIWIIRLSKGRVSVGVTFDRNRPPEGRTPKDQLFSVLAANPVFDGILSRDNLLEFRTYRDVQYVTDTFVHRDRYAMIGDASSIIDAYYSQGMGQSFQTSWHIANIVQKDVRDGELDTAYLDRVNHATFEDWLIIRNFVREKYTDAIADPRFFALTHMLDWAVIWSTGPARVRWTRWLSRTGGDPSLETPADRQDREYCEQGLFYSRARTWAGLPAPVVRRALDHLQSGIARRARWRVANGEQVPDIFCQQSLTRCLPAAWRLLGARPGDRVDLSGTDYVAPRRLRRPEARSWVSRLPLSTRTRFRIVILTRAEALLATFLVAYALDAADTARRKVRRRLRPLTGPARGGGRRHPADRAGATAAAEERG